MMLTPPAIASRDSPWRRLWQPRCTAVSEDEQAVSTTIAGPSKPKVKAMRPAARQFIDPVAWCASSVSELVRRSSRKSEEAMPTNTPTGCARGAVGA